MAIGTSAQQALAFDSGEPQSQKIGRLRLSFDRINKIDTIVDEQILLILSILSILLILSEFLCLLIGHQKRHCRFPGFRFTLVYAHKSPGPLSLRWWAETRKVLLALG